LLPPNASLQMLPEASACAPAGDRQQALQGMDVVRDQVLHRPEQAQREARH
jgi:hypothetical protein